MGSQRRILNRGMTWSDLYYKNITLVLYWDSRGADEVFKSNVPNSKAGILHTFHFYNLCCFHSALCAVETMRMNKYPLFRCSQCQPPLSGLSFNYSPQKLLSTRVQTYLLLSTWDRAFSSFTHKVTVLSVWERQKRTASTYHQNLTIILQRYIILHYLYLYRFCLQTWQ